MMKVTLVFNGRGISGLSSYSSNLRRVLSKNTKIEEVDVSKNIPKIASIMAWLVPFDIKALFSNHPLFLPKIKSDLVHFTSQNLAIPLLFRTYKNVVTVHDLALFEFNSKELFAGKSCSFLKKIFLKLNLIALKNANSIIVDSEFTKKRLVEMVRYPEYKIHVVYLGVDRRIYKPSRLVKSEKYPCTILYVGSEMPRKNLSVLFMAFARLKERLPQAKLVKIGQQQWPGSRERLIRLASDLDILNSVEFVDDTDDLATYYRRATLLVHPSIYEGFGFTVLEAMACGCPVICSDKTSLPEVAGKSAVYFDGYDTDDLAKKMYKVLTDKKLQDNMRKKGLKRADKFSWQKTVEKTIEVYRES